MSRVRTNQITNSAGTGAPNFPNGVTVTGVSTVTGNSQAGGNPISGAAQGTLMGSFGGFNATRTTSNNSVFVGYTEGDSVAKVDILANGSATFASNVEGRVFIGKTEDDTFGTFVSRNLANTNTATIYQNGAATFFGYVRSNEGLVVYPPLDSNYAFATRNAADSAWTAFIEANGKATFAGNVVLSTAGTGIDFSATSGTGTSELLDDYEEGTWTPTINAGSVGSYNWQSGKYTKIGNVMTIWFDVKWSGASSIPSTGSLGGLPITTVTGTDVGGFGAPAFRDANGVSSSNIKIYGNSSYFSGDAIVLQAYDSAGVASSVTWLASGRLTGWGQYFTN